MAHTVINAAPVTPASVGVSLAKPSDHQLAGMVYQPSEWALDRVRSARNPIVDSLPGHATGLAANDPITLASALSIMAQLSHERR